MKKAFLSIITATVAVSAIAQSAMPADSVKMRKKNFTRDPDLSRWALDINFLGGTLWQDLTSAPNTNGYLNLIAQNSNLGTTKFEKGNTFGGDINIGYFFGPGCHWGLGAGFMYLAQSGNLTTDKFHVEYQGTDANGNITRQHITANDPLEKVKITNMNIPVLLKYKYRFSKALGFTMDAGPMLNLQMTSKTTMTGSFDYEAINAYAEGGGQVFDGGVVPASTSELITRDFYMSQHPDGAGINAWFDQQRASGENVGLGRKPSANTSEVSYTTGSIGFLVRPELSWYLSDHVAINFGVYYMYQSFKNDNKPNYMMINGAEQYTTTLANVTSSNASSLGGNVGVRFLFGKLRDRDEDGIPDKRDKCPDVWGLEQFQGCPDTDKDGIQDSEDSCRTIPGIAKFNGCPDSDGDGLPDKDDECPYQAGPVALKGCPDRDGDGIADKNDLCPDKPGPAMYKGCPDTDGDGLADNEDQCPEVAGPASNNGCPLPPPPVVEVPLSTPILFETNKTIVSDVSIPVLETAIKTLKDDPNATVIIHGHADARGTNQYNMKLSLRRALSVKKQIVQMGGDAKRIKVMAHGENDPVASNSSAEGMAQNRRAVMRLSVE